MPKVIYLAGAPAAGKSSTTRMLAEQVPNLLIWEYGARLTEYLKTRSLEVRSQDDLRFRSSGLVTPADVAAVDQLLAAFVQEHRLNQPVVIDSHPVTKETYGYRITAFSHDKIAQLTTDEIWVLFASPDETRRRIADEPDGRPMITDEEARMHTALQASVAATYGIITGAPVYLFDTAQPRKDLVDRLVGRLA